MSWSSLSRELQEMILTSLIQNAKTVSYAASVCQEWQAVIEKQNFKRLTLTPARLDDFNEICRSKYSLVEHLWLSIELPEYDCSECEVLGHQGWDENITIIQDAIRKVFHSLSKRELKGNLTLDIGVHSPSDSKHHFKGIQFGSDAMPGSSCDKELCLIHDPRHGWSNGKQISLPSPNAIGRVFEDIEFGPEFWEDMPQVKAVTDLHLRRQTRRRWEHWTLQDLLSSLPNLQSLCYEPWREWNRTDQKISDATCKKLFQSLIPSRLKKVVIFEDFNDKYVKSWQGVHELVDAEPVRIADQPVTEALLEASLSLEHLSAAFIIDAKWFLNAHQPYWVWEKLVSLTLTSRELVPQESVAGINSMFMTAAKTAEKMPNLQNMELWNGGRGHACVFRYQTSRYSTFASLTWRANWDLLLKPEVIQRWKTLAHSRDASDLRVTKELLDTAEEIESHGDAVRMLQFSHHVVRPVSLWQIQSENRL